MYFLVKRNMVIHEYMTFDFLKKIVNVKIFLTFNYSHVKYVIEIQ